MLKTFIFFLTIAISFSVSSQYMQNIDKLSKNEIKNIILSLDEENETHIKFRKTQKGKMVGGVIMAIGSSIVITNAMKPRNDHHEGDIEGIMNGFLGLLTTVAGLVVFESSRVKQNKTIHTFKIENSNLRTTQIRDDKEVFRYLDPSYR